MIQRGPDGWPILLRDVKDIPVLTRRELANGHMVIPAGTPGMVGTSGNRWNKLMFTGDKCECCKVQARMFGCGKKDFDPA